MLEGMERVAHLISRYALVEALYLTHQGKSTGALVRTLIDLYGVILLFLVKAKQYYSQNTPCS